MNRLGPNTWAGVISLLIVFSILLLLCALKSQATIRTSAPDLSTSQGAGSVWENIRSLGRKLLNHRHDGTDGSSRLSDPYIDGHVILESPDGSCWSCGPDDAGTWGCDSATCT